MSWGYTIVAGLFPGAGAALDDHGQLVALGYGTAIDCEVPFEPLRPTGTSVFYCTSPIYSVRANRWVYDGATIAPAGSHAALSLTAWTDAPALPGERSTWLLNGRHRVLVTASRVLWHPYGYPSRIDGPITSVFYCTMDCVGTYATASAALAALPRLAAEASANPYVWLETITVRYSDKQARRMAHLFTAKRDGNGNWVSFSWTPHALDG